MTLRGLAASPGVYRGRVRVIRTTADLHRLRPGEVLVCPITTAAWMMTFQRAGALVADAGSVLSHTALVAREYGLPAVVATSNGTSTLVDGEEVVVDGNHGTVERVSPAPTSDPVNYASQIVSRVQGVPGTTQNEPAIRR